MFSISSVWTFVCYSRYPVEKVVHYPVKEYVDRPVPGMLCF